MVAHTLGHCPAGLFGREGFELSFHPQSLPRIRSGAGSEGARRERYSQFVVPAKAGIQSMGMSFDKLRTNDLSATFPHEA